MSRARLEARVGRVVALGWASLDGYRHAFSKRGDDGSGKGNIEAHPSSTVHGVLYELAPPQLDTLHPYEKGYRVVEVEVAVRADGRRLRAITYECLDVITGLAPTDDYIAHYRAGLIEHGLPVDYAAAILRSHGAKP